MSRTIAATTKPKRRPLASEVTISNPVLGGDFVWGDGVNFSFVVARGEQGDEAVRANPRFAGWRRIGLRIDDGETSVWFNPRGTADPEQLD